MHPLGHRPGRRRRGGPRPLPGGEELLPAQRCHEGDDAVYPLPEGILKPGQGGVAPLLVEGAVEIAEPVPPVAGCGRDHLASGTFITFPAQQQVHPPQLVGEHLRRRAVHPVLEDVELGGGDVVELGDEQLGALADLRDELLAGDVVLQGGSLLHPRRRQPEARGRWLTLGFVPLTYEPETQPTNSRRPSRA